MALPKVSAVMPVPSEMKKTVRVCMGDIGFLVMLSVCASPPAGAQGLQSGQLSDSSPCTAFAHYHKSKAGRRAMGKCAAARQHCTVFNFRSFPMSALFSPTALVVPFENLRMTDVEAVGGKNASSAR
jgi:hypothetical protein